MISVIIPVYNTDKYLAECLDSIISQTYQNLQIILVDDGSRDRSAEICRTYAESDKRITVIQQENGGSTNARKAGLRAAKGEYIAFIDSDDWVEADYFEKLYCLLTENKVDIVVSGCMIEKEGKTLYSKNRFKEGAYKGKALREDIYPKMMSFEVEGDFRFGILQYLCNKLYRRELIEPCIMRLDERIYDGEDVACLFDACLHASGIYVDNQMYYHYRIHGNSICTSKRDEKYFINAVRLNDYMSNYILASEEKEIMFPQLKHFMGTFMNNGTIAIMGFGYMKKYSDHMWKLPVIHENFSKICIFGAGKVGRSFYGQLLSYDDKEIVAWVDSSQHGRKIGGVIINEPEYLLEKQWDCTIIAVKDESAALEISTWLWDKGIPKNKIIWECPQRKSEGYELVLA